MPRRASSTAMAAPMRLPPVMMAARCVRSTAMCVVRQKLQLVAQPSAAVRVRFRRPRTSIIYGQRAGTAQHDGEQRRDNHEIVLDAVAAARRVRPVEEEAVAKMQRPDG